MKNGILFGWRIPVLGCSLCALGGGFCVVKPVELSEFPLTCLAATFFLACLERKPVLTSAVLPRLKQVVVGFGSS